MKMKANEISVKMADLITIIKTEEDLQKSESIQLIAELSDGMKESRIYKENHQRGAEFCKNMSAWDLWVHMIDKIAGTSSYLAAIMVSVLCIPFINDKLEVESNG